MMNPFQDQELLLVTSVVYSERFEVQGNRQQDVIIAFNINDINFVSVVVVRFWEIFFSDLRFL